MLEIRKEIEKRVAQEEIANDWRIRGENEEWKKDKK